MCLFIKLIQVTDSIPELLESLVSSTPNDSKIFVLPSYREGLPKVVLEASACGKPVITTDVPGCRDAITPAVTGLLVPPRDVGSLALSIKYLLQNESKREEFGIAGRKQAVREFDLELVIQKHLEIYALLVRDAQ